MNRQTALLPRLIALIAILLGKSFATPLHAGELSELRQSVRDSGAPAETPSSARPSRKMQSNFRDDDCDQRDDLSQGFSELLLYGGLVIASSPWTVPNYILEPGDTDGHELYFPSHPYARPEQHNLLINPTLDDAPFPHRTRLSVEYLDDFDDQQRIGGHLLWEHRRRWGVDSRWNYHREPLGGGHHDQLWTGDLNLTYRFAQNDRAEFRTGLGMNWLADRLDHDQGFNFTYAADFFPRRPWIISTELDLGRLGSAGLIHARATTGAILCGIETYAGYDYLDIGDADLSGFVFGLRLWR